MSKREIDAYLVKVPEPQRSTLKTLRETLQTLLPMGDECITYGFPTFKVDGRSIAGFASYKNHCSYFPMSGSTLSTLKNDVAKYETTRGALRFAVDKPLPLSLVKKLIKIRLREEASKVSKKSGLSSSYYENGVLQSKGRLISGELHGEWEWFRKDGSLMRTGTFDSGKQVGIWCTWDREGRLVKETNFDK